MVAITKEIRSWEKNLLIQVVEMRHFMSSQITNHKSETVSSVLARALYTYLMLRQISLFPFHVKKPQSHHWVLLITNQMYIFSDHFAWDQQFNRILKRKPTGSGTIKFTRVRHRFHNTLFLSKPLATVPSLSSLPPLRLLPDQLLEFLCAFLQRDTCLSILRTCHSQCSDLVDTFADEVVQSSRVEEILIMALTEAGPVADSVSILDGA